MSQQINPTRWKLYTDSEETWQAMLTACRSATKSIDLEQFIFVDDAVGKQFIEVCIERAKAGVKVRFLWDAAGSFSFFGSSIVDNLAKNGVELVFFKTLIPGFFKVPNYRSWFFRDHRRTLVIDGKLGFTGGIGVWEKMRDWRDMHVEIEGPVVLDMQKAFETMWLRAKGQQQKRIKKTHGQKKIKYERARNGSDFVYETNNPLPRKRFVYNRLIDAIRSAKKNIYITTPYFVPTRKLARVLRLAGHRGVDVRIIIPEYSDHPVVDLGARSYFQSLLESSVKIYLYKGPMIHSKTIIIDDEWASIGTLNMDRISLLHNFEANIISTNKWFAAELLEHFWADLKQAGEVTRADWEKRIFLMKVPEFLVTFVRKFL
jgi:cardiolipin synthase